MAKFLISAGADVLIPAKNGCTAFDMASLIGTQPLCFWGYTLCLCSDCYQWRETVFGLIRVAAVFMYLFKMRY